MTDINWEELAGTLFEEAGDALLLFEPDTEEVREANPMAQRLTGFTRKDLLAMKVTHLFRSEGEGGLDRLRSAFRRTGLFHSQEGFWLRQKRANTWVQVNLTVTRLHTGAGTLGLITARDISERRESLARVQAAEAELRRVLTSVADCLWSAEVTLEGQWVYRYISPVVERITGRSPDYYLPGPERWLSMVYEEDRPRLRDMFDRLKSGQSMQEEYRIVRPGGALRWVRDRVVARPGVHGVGCRLDGVLADTTQRKQVEQALRRSESRYRLLIDQIPAVVWTTDTDLRITSSVGGGLANVQMQPHQNEGLLLTEVLGTEDPNFLPLAAHHRALAGETSTYEMEWRGRSWHTHIEPMRFAEGRTVGVIGLSLDITERKRIEEALRESESRHRLLLEQIPAVVWTTNAELRFTSGAGAGLARLNLPQPMAGMTLFDLFGTRDEAFPPIVAHRRALAGATVAYEMNWMDRTWHSHVEPLHDDKGVAFGVIGLALDITDRKRAEEALRGSEAKYRSLIENLPLSVFLKDCDLRFVAVNPPFCRALGRPETEIVGKNDLDFFPAEMADKYRTDDRRVLREKRRIEIEEQTPIQGRIRTVQTVKTPVLDDQGTPIGVLGIFWDVTDQRNLEAQLRQAHKMEAVGKLAGGIAHDFNNLLTGILGNLSLALGDLAGHPAQELLANAEVAAQRAAELTRQLLGFSRRTPILPQSLDLNHCIQETVRLLRRTFDPRVTVEVHSAPDLWPVEADSGQVNQVLMNLCLNARDAMPQGGRLTLETANVSLDVPAASRFLGGQPGDFVRLRIRDSGHGMSAEVRERIFEPFFTTKEPGKGTGLGLAMVFGIVQQHHGWVECFSTVGQGTAFEVYLPRQEAAAPAVVEAPVADGIRGGHETILLVDDEEVIGRLGRTILERHGYQVIHAIDGAEAVDLYRRKARDIDLVILDLAMPRLSGADTLRELRKINPGVVVLISSGYSSDEDLRAVEREGVMGFVAKPYKPADLARRVRAALDQDKAEAPS